MRPQFRVATASRRSGCARLGAQTISLHRSPAAAAGDTAVSSTAPPTPAPAAPACPGAPATACVLPWDPLLGVQGMKASRFHRLRKLPPTDVPTHPSS